MGVFLNDDVLKLALERIRAEEPDYKIELNLSKSRSGTVVVSRDKNDLLSLDKIEHNGVTYYVGLQR